jgi:hypothetical protein
MANEIISYLDMCQREGLSLQRGMNFQAGKGYSIVLMSTRPGAPYRDRYENGGLALIYEGHDIPRTQAGPDPKSVDQPEFIRPGSRTDNGKFHEAAQNYRQGLRSPEKVKVYEKIRNGIWSYNGLFDLIDSWQEADGDRHVFKFKLIPAENTELGNAAHSEITEPQRMIPNTVKREVWKRDNGRCVKCGATTELHFDHVIPYSRGGTSLSADNIQLLCARHNLEKRDRIE